jgi:hypothetical protein
VIRGRSWSGAAVPVRVAGHIVAMSPIDPFLVNRDRLLTGRETTLHERALDACIVENGYHSEPLTL